MRITPLDVRKQEFRKVVRGLDAEEVYAFLATVAEEYEAALTDNKTLREQMLGLDEKVGEYRNMETALRDTLMTAERVNGETRQNAEKEAALILERAKIEAQKETASISARVESLRHQLRDLRSQRDAFLSRLRTLSQTQLSLLDNYQRDFEQDDRDAIGATSSAARAAANPVPPVSAPPVPRPNPAPPVAIHHEDATRPIPHLAESPHASLASDQWREYSVGLKGAVAGPRVAMPAPGDPVISGRPADRRVDDDVDFELDGSEDLADVVAEVSGRAPGGHPQGNMATSRLPESGSDEAKRQPETVGAPADRSGGWSMQRFTSGLQDG